MRPKHNYTNPRCVQFVEDMDEAGYTVFHYTGRSFWQGPAVEIDRSEFQDVIRATDVRVQSDEMGLNLVIYPVASDEGSATESEEDGRGI